VVYFWVINFLPVLESADQNLTKHKSSGNCRLNIIKCSQNWVILMGKELPPIFASRLSWFLAARYMYCMLQKSTQYRVVPACTRPYGGLPDLQQWPCFAAPRADEWVLSIIPIFPISFFLFHFSYFYYPFYYTLDIKRGIPHIMLRDELTQKFSHFDNITVFGYPRACRFRKPHQTNQFWSLRAPSNFFQNVI
jgi:hypothetical protein